MCIRDRPLGVFDPLGLIETRDMRRYEIMEIKHGRAAMLGFLHVILVEAGAKIPTEECLAAPTGMIASLESMPTSAWLQIMVTTCMMETGYFLFDYEGYPNVGDREAGDIGGEAWVRYDDPEAKTFKLNVERQNGRAAMLGRAAACSKSDSSGLSDCVGAMEGVLRVSSRSYESLIFQPREHVLQQCQRVL